MTTSAHLGDEERHLRGKTAVVLPHLVMIGAQHHLKVMVRRIQRTSNWGPEHKDICDRSRSEIDKGRKDDDRRFRAIQDHPVDYFNRWMVEAGGNIEALGEYDYPSSALRHRESRDEDS